MPKFDLESCRNKILDAFNKCDYNYSHVTPHYYSGYIDGLFHVSMLYLAAHTANDTEILNYAREYLAKLSVLGSDARNYSNEIKKGWEYNTKFNLYVKRKEQCKAGPICMNILAKRTNISKQITNMYKYPASTVKLITNPIVLWLSGLLVRAPIIGKLLRQHINTIMLACMAENIEPPSTWEWVTYENPFYSFIFNKKMNLENIPEMFVYSKESIKENNNIVPLEKREPSPWIWKQWPYNEYVKDGKKTILEYTPTAFYVAYHLQNTL